jgi:hypothetical protein
MPKTLILLAILSIAALLTPMAKADSLSVTLDDANQTVVAGTTVVQFFGSIYNPSTMDRIYLNSDSSTTDSSGVTVDDTPFFANAPYFLDPGASSGDFEIFDVDLATGLAPGVYTGVFSIYGGADGGADTANDDLADVDFSVQVTSTVPTPEPTSILLLFAGLAGVGLLNRRRRLSSI